MNVGEVFLIPDGIGIHRYFVLAVLKDGSLVMCHFTSRGARSDLTCIVQAGEHSSIDRETVVRYDQAHVCAADRITNLESVITKKLDPLSEELFARVRQGALDSSQTPDYIKDLLR